MTFIIYTRKETGLIAGVYENCDTLNENYHNPDLYIRTESEERPDFGNISTGKTPEKLDDRIRRIIKEEMKI